MAIHIMPERTALGEIVKHDLPFKTKAVNTGKLYRRKHGFKGTVIMNGAEGNIELIVPYDKAKINEFEFISVLEGTTVDFKVYDTPAGTISTVPNLMLNQFGFDVEMPNGFYRDVSEYDADVIKDMKIVLTVKNNTGSPITPKGNIVYHEVKA